MEKLGCIKKKKIKFICSFFSGVFYIMGQGVLLSSGALSVYVLSYIHHQDKWVDMMYGNLMMPFMGLFTSLFSPLSGPLEKLCGPIISLLISSIIVEVCLYLFYIRRNIWIYYSISFLSGFGIGLSANIPVKNACFYYPEKKGLISSSMLSFIGISVAGYVLVGEQLINPDKKGVIDQKTDPYYSLEVSENCRKYYLFGMCVLPIGTLLSFLFFYKYDPKCENEEKESEKSEEKEENKETKETEEKELKDALINKHVKNKKLNSFYKPSPSKNIKIALKNFRFWRNILITILLPFWILFIQSTFRAYVVMLGVNTNIIFFLGSGVTLIGCLLGPVWASLVDKFGFQPIMKIIAFICSLMSIYFYFFIDDKILYPIGLIFIISALVGIMSAMTPHLMHIYGLRYFLTIGGFSRLFNELGNFGAALASIIFSIFWKNAEELVFPYQMMIVGGGAFSFLGFILVFFENDEKFIYGDENEEVNQCENEETNTPNDTFEKEKKYINENTSTILDINSSNRTTLNNDENKKDK